MRGVVFVLCLMAAVSAQEPPVKYGAISGVVVDSVTGRPLAGARVSVRKLIGAGSTIAPDQSMPGRRVVTDAKGRFVFTGLPAADGFFLDASRFGYSATRYGWTEPDGPSTLRDIKQISLADGKWVSGISIPLWRLGAITGRVVDERAEPVVGAAVRVFRTGNIAGQPQLVAGDLTSTDDRGVYRIGDLKPGKYFVSVLSVQSTVTNAIPEVQIRPMGDLATGGIGAGNGALATGPGIEMDGKHRLVLTNFATPPPPSAQETRAYPAMFYPSVATQASATAIEIGYGDLRTGIDFALQPVSTVTVSGRVDAGGVEPPPMLLRLMPVGSERLGFGSEAATTVIERDGTFTFLNVPSGDYTLIAQGPVMDFTSGTTSTRMPDAPGFPAGGISVGSMPGAPGLSYLTRSAQTEPRWGRMSVAVGRSPVAGLMLTLHPTVRVSGRLVFAEGVTPPPPATRLVVGFQPANGDPTLGQPISRTQTEPAFSFTVDGLMGGTYLFGSGFLSYGIVSAMWDGRDLRDTGFDASGGRDFDGVVITLTDKKISLNGTVRDNGEPKPSAVIAFPADRERWTNYGWGAARFRTARTSQAGTYVLDGMPDGDYFVIAVETSQVDAWSDPKFLAAAMPFAERVSLKWGETRPLDLRFSDVRIK
jgi:hypothetical protein